MDKIEELRQKILPILLPYGVECIALFGSVVRGEDTSTSDVDVLVRLKPIGERPPLGLLRWVALEEQLSHVLRRKVDLVTEEGMSPYIRPYVDAEKVILYEE